MTNTVISEAVGPRVTSRASTVREKRSSAFYGYSLLGFLIAAGWLTRERDLINPESGLGYWLGIVGASLMLALLLYPLRKRFRFMQRLGATRHWFRMHMIFGLLGPLLILYHCNFQLGSFNSRVAFFCMLLVAGSGIVGRHFYARRNSRPSWPLPSRRDTAWPASCPNSSKSWIATPVNCRAAN